MCMPGWNRFTATRPIPTAIAVTVAVYVSVFQPSRPSEAMSPSSATPSTSAENISGTTSMNSRLRKICPKGLVA